MRCPLRNAKFVSQYSATVDVTLRLSRASAAWELLPCSTPRPSFCGSPCQRDPLSKWLLCLGIGVVSDPSCFASLPASVETYACATQVLDRKDLCEAKQPSRGEEERLTPSGLDGPCAGARTYVCVLEESLRFGVSTPPWCLRKVVFETVSTADGSSAHRHVSDTCDTAVNGDLCL